MDNLLKILKNANRAYREGTPIMSDVEYDALEDKLRQIDPENDWFKRGVNDDKPKNREFELPYPMMSLDKIKRHDELMAWMKQYPKASFIVMPKYDGLSVGMSVSKSWTRGNGVVGQDCTEHVSAIYVKPEISDGLTVRGEIIIDNIDWESFKTINTTAKSQRNSATGLINGDFDIKRKEEYGLLRVMPYEIQGSELDKEKQLEIMMNNNYKKVVNPFHLTEESLLQMFMSWGKLYPIDGLVIEVNENEYRHNVEANGNPSYAVAYKHPSFSEMGRGVIEKIERNVNREGVVTPVIVLKEPINLAGADIQRVHGINMKYIYDWRLYPEETVTIVRSGEVIPKIIGVGDSKIPFREEFNSAIDYNDAYVKAVEGRKEEYYTVSEKFFKKYLYELSFCPVCHKELKPLYNPDGTWCEEVCTNEQCIGKILSSLVKFFEIAGLDGFGPKTIEQLMYEGNVSDFWGILNFSPSILKELEGWGEKSIENFLNEMERIKTTLPFARFLHATGWFADLGEKTIQKIIDADGWGKDVHELIEIEGVQKITADKFTAGFYMHEEYSDIIQHFFKFAYVKTPKAEGKLSGMVVCATGFRDQVLFKNIKDNGGVVGDGVTKETNCLIVKDINSTSSKVKKAQKMGIEILDIHGFKEKYFNSSNMMI